MDRKQGKLIGEITCLTNAIVYYEVHVVVGCRLIGYFFLKILKANISKRLKFFLPMLKGDGRHAALRWTLRVTGPPRRAGSAVPRILWLTLRKLSRAGRRPYSLVL